MRKQKPFLAPSPSPLPQRGRGLRVRGVLVTVLFALMFSPLVLAESGYELKEITPAVQKAISGRQSRYQEIQRLKTSGVLGEGNQGFVSVLQPSPALEAIAANENADRQAIYQAIADQNQLGPNGMAQIQSVFAEVQRGKAQAGEFIQLRSGEWAQK